MPDLYEPYCVPYGISVKQTDQSVIIDISLNYEDYYRGWMDQEGGLAELVSIRDALMKGDLRVLYLAWLATGFSSEGYDWDETTVEPPVPPNLKKLSPALEAFANLFEIGTDLIEIAAKASPSKSIATEEPVEEWIAALPEDERNQYLYIC